MGFLKPFFGEYIGRKSTGIWNLFKIIEKYLVNKNVKDCKEYQLSEDSVPGDGGGIPYVQLRVSRKYLQKRSKYIRVPLIQIVTVL